MEVLLHGGTTVGGWTAKQIHQAVLTTFELPAKTYGLNQLRSDLRKLKVMACSNVTGAAMPTASLPKVYRSQSCSCSSTSASAVLSPTGASTTKLNQHADQIANSKPPITRSQGRQGDTGYC